MGIAYSYRGRDQGPPPWLILFVILALAGIPFAIYFHITQSSPTRSCICRD